MITDKKIDNTRKQTKKQNRIDLLKLLGKRIRAKARGKLNNYDKADNLNIKRGISKYKKFKKPDQYKLEYIALASCKIKIAQIKAKEYSVKKATKFLRKKLKTDNNFNKFKNLGIITRSLKIVQKTTNKKQKKSYILETSL
ncbi:2169_t:CDS:2 [Dentiscutata heterogama]|uniref:2169_t:CDS:1 n=1 Tax=Dentiscutata heterogama TaxID=1316150 RepID=A0ACA9JY97_9GLOM|nr:2169_t:CDS:2 [Dentiscutata heterogama]